MGPRRQKDPDPLTTKDSLLRRRELIIRDFKVNERYFQNNPFISSLSDVKNFSARIEELQETFKEFKLLQRDIELYDDDTEVREDFWARYFSLTASMQAEIDRFQRHSKPPYGSDSVSVQSLREHLPMAVKLPEIAMPTFDGNFENWIPFRDNFTAAVLNQPGLPKISKFQYLVSALKGPAKQIIENLTISEANFDTAWENLTKRFDDNRRLVSSHITALFNPPKLQRECAQSIRNIIDHFRSHKRAIENLEIKVPLEDLLLTHLIVQELDYEIKQKWEDSIHNEIPTFDQCLEFLEKQNKTYEMLKLNDPSPLGNLHCKTLSNNVTNNTLKCFVCSEAHSIYSCPQFQKLSPASRVNKAKALNLCSVCLRKNTSNHTCSKMSCKSCAMRHHTLLHDPNFRDNSQQMSSDKPTHFTGGSCKLSAHTGMSSSILPTAIVTVRNASGLLVTCNAVLDSASHFNFVTHQCAKSLGLSIRKCNHMIDTLGDMPAHSPGEVSLQLGSRWTSWQTKIHAFVMPIITPHLPPTHIDVTNWQIPSHLQYADASFNQPKNIDILLGADVFFSVLRSESIKPDAPLPVIHNTELGWIFAGRLPPENPSKGNCLINILNPSNEQLQNKMEVFWKIEEVQETSLSKLDEQCETHFVQNVLRTEKGRYMVKLPLKEEGLLPTPSRGLAIKRLHALERRLARDPILREEYVAFMKDYEDSGHMSQIHHVTSSERYHIPHHPVFKSTSSTTKVRVVFDASATPYRDGISLNQILLPGPVVQPDLFTVLLRFRTFPVCFMADIKQMFRQILVHPSDRDKQCIVWRESPDQPIKDYHLNTVTYGTAPASFLATRTLMQLAEDLAYKYPIGSDVLKHHFYVDDCCSGADTESAARLAVIQLNQLLQEGGFHLRKWTSNTPSILDVIPTEDLQILDTHSFDGSSSVFHTLGLLWNATQDSFQISINISSLIPSNQLTKRSLLSIIASIFDPLGLISPVVISCKILFQELWTLNINWDDTLPSDIVSRWEKIYYPLHTISDINIPRLIKYSIHNDYFQIHGFCDASEKAYGACIYLVSFKHGQEVKSHLICAKSRVSPIKAISIPRLELCAAVLLAKLLAKISTVFIFSIKETYLWSDSKNALTWITSQSRNWKPFIANRVSYIQTRTESCTWLHVPTKENPADVLSRGTMPALLKHNSLWWHGPSWLCSSQTHWPQDRCKFLVKAPESKICFITSQPPINSFSELLLRFSSFTKLCRVFSYVLRFVHNTRHPRDKRTDSLSVSELLESRLIIAKMVQFESYPRELASLRAGQEIEKNSSLYSLSPFLHSDGTLRVGGRLQRSNLDFDQRHQIILPHIHHVTKLIISQSHQRLLHAGTQAVMCDVRNAFWVTRLRTTVRNILRRCIICFRQRAVAAKQQMAPLPEYRVNPSHPFQNVGIDLCGPFMIKYGGPRSKITSKAYIALFICMSTKAVHTEIVSDLSTKAFLASFSRFTSRRGIPSNIFSDNATNFHGTNKELTSLIHSSKFQENIVTPHALLSIQWHFNPPAAPHFGGLWESNIKSLKSCLKKASQDTLFTFEELSTLVVSAEAVMNSRPLALLSEDPDDNSPLTPGHFLIGRPLVAIASYTGITLNETPRSRWDRCAQSSLVLWDRWSKEYLNTLQRRSKWASPQNNCKVGTPVLLRTGITPFIQWQLAVIEQVHPANDGKVRVVTLRTPTGLYKRPIVDVAPLPLTD